MKNHHINHHEQGFSLLELLVTLAIVAIIAAISIPAYQSYVMDARRGDGQSALIAFAAAMDKHRTQNNTYLGAAQGGDTGAPAIFETTAPLGSSAVFYDLTIEAATGSTFTLRATPTNAQSGDGYLEIDSLDQKRWDEDNSGSIGAGEFDWNKG